MFSRVLISLYSVIIVVIVSIKLGLSERIIIVVIMLMVCRNGSRKPAKLAVIKHYTRARARTLRIPSLCYNKNLDHVCEEKYAYGYYCYGAALYIEEGTLKTYLKKNNNKRRRRKKNRNETKRRGGSD